MSNQRYSPEFKDEAARQIVDRGLNQGGILRERIVRQVTITLGVVPMRMTTINEEVG